MSDELTEAIARGRRRADGEGGRPRPRASSPGSAPVAPIPALVEKLPVDYYGSDVPLQQLASFSVPEAPDAHDHAVRQGLDGRHRAGDPATSDLGLNPSNDGVADPPHLPAAHRGAAQGVREARQGAWPRTAATRCARARREARKDLEALEKDGDISEDDLRRAETELDKLTKAHEAEIDEALGRRRPRS